MQIRHCEHVVTFNDVAMCLSSKGGFWRVPAPIRHIVEIKPYFPFIVNDGLTSALSKGNWHQSFRLELTTPLLDDNE